MTRRREDERLKRTKLKGLWDGCNVLVQWRRKAKAINLDASLRVMNGTKFPVTNTPHLIMLLSLTACIYYLRSGSYLLNNILFMSSASPRLLAEVAYGRQGERVVTTRHSRGFASVLLVSTE